MTMTMTMRNDDDDDDEGDEDDDDAMGAMGDPPDGWMDGWMDGCMDGWMGLLFPCGLLMDAGICFILQAGRVGTPPCSPRDKPIIPFSAQSGRSTDSAPAAQPTRGYTLLLGWDCSKRAIA